MALGFSMGKLDTVINIEYTAFYKNESIKMGKKLPDHGFIERFREDI